VYAPEGPAVPGAELVPCLSNKRRIEIFGADDPNRLPAWPKHEQSAEFNQNVIAALRDRLLPRDIILLSAGWTHKPVCDAFPEHIRCEPGVGYEGILTGFCAFESAAWRNHVYGLKEIRDGRWFDTVIPNFFDPDDFTQDRNGSGDYLLFLGRIIARKGPHIASQIAEAAGVPLVVAGAGGKQVGKNIVANEVTMKNAQYVGPVNIEQRAKLLAGARCLIVPTTYIEPFGGVAVEAMMCGTPVVASDFGAFTETVENGVSGYRFNTLAEGVEAVNECKDLDRDGVKQYAMNNYSLEAVGPKFITWFNRLESLWQKGWYQI
jgi:glycosyltransferase involved in cell wall biosynthesis